LTPIRLWVTFAAVDTTCRLHPLGYGERIAAFSSPLPERTGQQRKPLTSCFVQAKDDDMRDFRDAKIMAHTLRAALAAKGLKITVAQSLELIAAAFGVADWNTLAAAIRAERVAPHNKPSPPPPRVARVSGSGFSIELELTIRRALAFATQRRHEYATLEHLLLALLDDADAAAVLRACRVDFDVLRSNLTRYIDLELGKLIVEAGGEAKPTAAFQRVFQRAAIQVQSAGREETIRAAHVLEALFAERESHAAFFLQEQDVTRYDVVNYISHGIAKGGGGAAV
jgi:Glyoxalase superfamily protein/Clp amino terminal domain, pathogenicity island component